MARSLGTPTLYAEHYPELHRTVNPDKSVTEVELPGFVSVGVTIGGARKELARFKAGKFLGKLTSDGGSAAAASE